MLPSPRMAPFPPFNAAAPQGMTDAAPAHLEVKVHNAGHAGVQEVQAPGQIDGHLVPPHVPAEHSSGHSRAAQSMPQIAAGHVLRDQHHAACARDAHPLRSHSMQRQCGVGCYNLGVPICWSPARSVRL